VLTTALKFLFSFLFSSYPPDSVWTLYQHRTMALCLSVCAYGKMNRASFGMGAFFDYTMLWKNSSTSKITVLPYGTLDLANFTGPVVRRNVSLTWFDIGEGFYCDNLAIAVGRKLTILAAVDVRVWPVYYTERLPWYTMQMRQPVARVHLSHC